VDSIWTLQYFTVQSLVESWWTPCGLHMDSAVFDSREFTGVLLESLWSPCGVPVESIWTYGDWLFFMTK